MVTNSGFKPGREGMKRDAAGYRQSLDKDRHADGQRDGLADVPQWVWAGEASVCFCVGITKNTTLQSSDSLRRPCLHGTANLLCGRLAQHGLTDTVVALRQSCASAVRQAWKRTCKDTHRHTHTHIHSQSWHCGCV